MRNGLNELGENFIGTRVTPAFALQIINDLHGLGEIIL